MKPRRRHLTPIPALLPLLALVGLALGGCGDEPEPTAGDAALTPDAFVEIVVALREAEREVVDSDSAAAAFEARKDSILTSHDASEQDLHEFLERHRSDFSVMAAVWDSITQRLKYLPGASTPGVDPRTDERP